MQRLSRKKRKSSYFSQDAGAKIAQIQKLVKEMKHEIEFKLIANTKRVPCRFQQKPLGFLIKRGNEKVRELRENA